VGVKSAIHPYFIVNVSVSQEIQFITNSRIQLLFPTGHP
jgi:hypothetical protein